MSDLNMTESVCNYTENIKYKDEKSILNISLSSFLAGIFISLGAFVSVNVGLELPVGLGKFLGGIAFSSALILIVLSGLELFTGNVLTTFSFLTDKFKLKSFLKLWILVYFGNLLGCLVSVLLLNNSGLCNALYEKFISIASMKCSLTFTEAFIRGIFCNMLVCIAVLVANQAKTVQGKIFGIMVPITVFIASGYEHSIANMFFIPMGKATINQFLHNIIPVTFGNIIGAIALVLIFYYCNKNKFTK